MFFLFCFVLFFFFFMASNFSVIPIRWLLTVDSEMVFSRFHSLSESVLVCATATKFFELIVFAFSESVSGTYSPV